MALPNKQSYSNLGGELHDYSPATDPTTDLTAESSNEMRADVAAMTATCVKSYFMFTVNAGVVSIANTDFDSVYGNAIIYKPTAVYNSAGNYTFTLPSSIVDARGLTKSINIKCGFGSAASQNYFVSVNISSSNVVRVFLMDCTVPGVADPGSASDKVTVFLV